MSDDFPLDFSTLRKGLVIGPEHHQFKLIKPVSNSPIGQVWHADDLSLGEQSEANTRVALEIVNPALLEEAATVEAFKTQVTRCKPLEHRHIARTYGYFLSREGWLFVAMEPVATRSLARILLEDGYDQLSAERARIILTQIAQGLDYAHQQGITHGDLSPWNIIITREAGAKLVNLAFRQPLLQQIQRQGHRLLNTEYHPPEAYEQVPLAASADIYPFACLVYQLFAGRPPFISEVPVESRDPEAVPAPPGFSERQWALLRRALAADPAQRPDSAVTLIEQLFTEEPTPVPSRGKDRTGTSLPPAESSTAPQTRPARSGAWRAAAGGLLLFAAGAAAGYLLANEQQKRSLRALLDQVAQIQRQLAAPASPAGEKALADALADLESTRPDPALLDGLNQLLASYRKSLEPAPVKTPPRAKPVETRAALTSRAADEQTIPEGAVIKAGAVFKDEILPDVFGPNMVVVPAGTFRMGDIDGDGDDNELPVHPVSIPRAFALSEKEITFAEYDLFALSTGRDLPDDEGWGRGERPVINVSWNDANAYAHWVRRQTGLAYRLPSEAEWEYAARAGNASRFWWGDTVGEGNAACDGCGSPFDGKQTAPTGSFDPNPFGLYDMNGNAYEWVADCYNDSYTRAPDDGSAWTQGQCQYRVMRGGSWYDTPRLIRSASRYRHPANASLSSWGFRLALDLEG
ncbi:bifunctional serine/threonine-protein kinase/formylglycine-generating enzyme family protein [Motiliproteus sp. SC1-56]|uniref:bifunctional serine/threonine-protein kinase/formylglycine-generating enzyme family protein n=1 Tax=Motiliproteus sp. SC1-56 TaxID=2799565 RepID=UPI001A8DA7D1|nr:bifunctional serine/threonine-protein kinase/formylglycine-generating enzyme family protein [Motiliproteus sp. SC1-56]